MVSTKEEPTDLQGPVPELCSTHEETDTKIILHALYASDQGATVQILSPDTDVLILALRRLPEIGRETCIFVGLGCRRRWIPLHRIYDAIGEHVTKALPGFHSFTGCDAIGHFAMGAWEKSLAMDSF